MSDADQITIHSSWRGVVWSHVGALSVLLVGVITVSANGTRMVPMLVLAGGVVLTTGALFDYPVAATFDRVGVTRRAPLRRHRIRWERVDQLTRTRPGIFMSRRKVVRGGLTAAVGKRRYLLTDSVESLAEHEALAALLDGHDLGFDGLLHPPDDVAPTWLYRRRKWRPDTDA